METKRKRYFTAFELALWLGSAAVIAAAFAAFDRENYLTLAASLIGVTSLIFCAKGNPIGQALMIAFSIIYGVISFSFAYYGEMITYLGMTMPIRFRKLAQNGKTAAARRGVMKVAGCGRIRRRRNA